MCGNVLTVFLISILQTGSHYSHITAKVKAFGQTFLLRLFLNRLICTILADRNAIQCTRLLALLCPPSVCLSVCNAVHYGSQGRCTGLKVVPACS